jgi:Protein of unknown function (DUF742)
VRAVTTSRDGANPDDPDDGGRQATRVVGRTGARFGSRAMRRGWQEDDDEPAAGEPTAEQARHAERVQVGRTGARFGSAAMRRGWQDEPAAEEPEEPSLPAERPEVGRTGARFGSPALRRAWQEGDDEQQPDDTADDSAEAEEWADLPTEPLPMIAAQAQFDVPESVYSRVRPYALTGGRTEASYDLQLETLLSFDSRDASPDYLDRLDHRSIVETCYVPTSVAEVAATQSIPLGVAKILISDLIDLGVLIPHQVAVDAGQGPSRALLERVLDGLHRL